VVQLEIVRSRTVKGFLNNISPLSELVSKNILSEYVFRGHGDSKWPLVPSAFRPTTKFPFQGDFHIGYQANYRNQRDMEWSLLKDFILEINRNGFHIPDEALLYKLLDPFESIEEYNKITRFEDSWPNREYYSILALAQHFGMPTRLMDWSYNPLVAAYFAAKGCLKQMESGKKVSSLSVYAINKNSSLLKSPYLTKEIMPIDFRKSHVPIVTYHVVEAPTYFNNNLLAQKGLFICCTEYGNIKNQKFKPIALNEYFSAKELEEQNTENKTVLMLSEILARSNGVNLFDFRLPASLSAELLIELDKLFINSSSLFPGISGCIDSLYDRCLS
jgi:FRG domain